MSTATPVPRPSVGQLVLGADGAVREGNARAAQILGVEAAGALAGASLAELIGARPAAQVRAHAEGDEGGACEVAARLRDGSVAALGFTPTRRADGAGATLVVAELCAGGGPFAEVVEATLREAVHGLRNPLAAALNSMDLVQRGLASPDDLPALNRVTRNGLERIDRMLAGLHALARAGRLAVLPASPDDIVREAVTRVAQRAQARRVAVVARTGRRLPPVRLDADSVVAAVEALLENAIDASAEGDEVDVEAAWVDAARELHVTVTDRGEGIPAERAANVFRMYFSSRRALGVGLTFARWVAAAHGGDVALRGPPEGGTVATLRLRA